MVKAMNIITAMPHLYWMKSITGCMMNWQHWNGNRNIDDRLPSGLWVFRQSVNLKRQAI